MSTYNEWTGQRKRPRPANSVWVALLVCSAVLVGVLLVLHNQNMRAYNRCVGLVEYNAQQHEQAQVDAGGTPYIPTYRTDDCHRTWP